MIDVAKLKGKGEPPPMEAAPNNTSKPPRETKEETKPLQFWVPASVREEFSIEAVKAGGGVGAKSELFLKVWNAYKGR